MVSICDLSWELSFDKIEQATTDLDTSQARPNATLEGTKT